MSVVNNTLLLAAEEGGYRIDRSLRFRSSATAYLSRTPASASNRKTWTYSFWFKRAKLGAGQPFMDTRPVISDSQLTNIQINASDAFVIGGGSTDWRVTTQVFRDVSAWYHGVVVLDTTQATASNRWKLYINGNQVTTFSTANDPSLNADLGINQASATSIGALGVVGTALFDGYLTEINFVDGQALTPSSFGEYNADTGVWQPKKYAGTYGTNGFYLNFSDNASTTTLGDDLSGNGNDWTTNNISVTAGATYDSMIDVPTPYADGGNGRGNYCTLNPVGSDMGFGSLSNGNLTATTNFRQKRGTIGVNTGKWYWEVLCVSDANPSSAYAAGVVDVSTNVATNPFSSGSGAVFYYGNNGNKYINGTQTSYGSTYTTNDVIGVALDMDSGTVTFYKNNTSQGSVTLHSATAIYVPLVHSGSSDPNNTVYAANFGQRPFAYTPPTGFKALNTQNLPESTVVDGGEYFNTVLWTGNGVDGRPITGVGFQPDLVWIKNRSTTNNHTLTDVLRGPLVNLRSSTTGAETTDPDSMESFDSDGFTVGDDGAFNGNGNALVAWNWKANGAGVTNTAGSITSTVSANTTAGFSVVTYTGNGTNGATVGHGLGVAPAMMIVKNRNSTQFWIVQHQSLATITRNLYLQTTDSVQNDSQFTSKSSTTVTLGGPNSVNTNGNTYVMYCFSEVAGYSAFGSYTGNGSADGPFVFCGFRPKFVITKRIDSGDNWIMSDSKRGSFNFIDEFLNPNTSSAESNNNITTGIDYLSNGFKLRSADGSVNASGGTYIFMAFAENPFKYALAR
jgi:hypothetical protein